MERNKSGIARTPRSVEQITQAAQEYGYDVDVPLRYWFRTAKTLLKEAAQYQREGDIETTYLLLFRHAHLILTQLSIHPDARDPTLRVALKDAKADVQSNLRYLDELRPLIKQRYERYLLRKRDADAQAQTGREQSSQSRRRSEDGAAHEAQQLQAHEHRDYAVRLHREEMNRRRAASNQDTQAPGQTDDLVQRMQSLRSRIDLQQDSPTQTKPTSPSGSVPNYSYPTVPSKQGRQYPRQVPIETTDQRANRIDFNIPPSLPPKPKADYSSSVPTPQRPKKVPDSPKEVSKGMTYTFAPAAYLENGSPLRTLFLPPTLRTTFLRLAHKNTLKNLETCAFLAGTVIANALFVSKLIVPAQTASSDTCEMTNESDLFDYVESQEDLIVLGWIHTHPTQTCFMSSRDLHTHASYQAMMAESVAIVCAPSMGDTSHGGDWGAFRLTDPPGKKVILNCTKPGIFHPHDVDHLYTDALRPGHVAEAPGLEFEVVDLREFV